KERAHMPVSKTTPGRLGARVIAPIRVAFRQRNDVEPPPNEWTSVVGSLSPEVSNGTSTSVIYRRVQAPGCRACVVGPSLGHVGGQGARSARRGAAALGGQVPAGAGIGGVAPHHAGDADVGGPGFGDRPVTPGERTAAHGARHFKKVDR